MYLFHIPQCIIQNTSIHLSVLNGALWDMDWLRCGIFEIVLFHPQTHQAFYLFTWFSLKTWMTSPNNPMLMCDFVPPVVLYNRNQKQCSLSLVVNSRTTALASMLGTNEFEKQNDFTKSEIKNLVKWSKNWMTLGFDISKCHSFPSHNLCANLFSNSDFPLHCS